MIRKLAVREDDVHRRRPNASKKLAEFKAQQIERVMEIELNADTYSDWLSSVARERQQVSSDLQKSREEVIIERFVALGYAEEDVSPFSRRKEFSGTAQLSDRIWQRIRPVLEPEIAACKAKRLEDEYQKIKNSRRRIVDGLYGTYKASLHPSQWKYLPRTFDICEQAPFAAIVNTPRETIVTAADFADAMQALPALLSSVSVERTERARALLPAASNVSREPGDAKSPDVLDLATSVFECRNYRHGNSFPVIGVEDLLSHHCGTPDHGTTTTIWHLQSLSEHGLLTFSQEGSQVAASLVRLARLDPRTALASDMDKKDLRFSCSRCQAHNVSASWRRRGYSWRTAMSHALQDGHAGAIHEYRWAILSPEDADAVKACERSDAKWESESWTCGRCSTYVHNLQKRAAILDHLKVEHQITDPKEDDDFVFCERFRSPFKGKIVYPVPRPTREQLRAMSGNNSLKVHCHHCASGPQNNRRVFDVSGAKQHIQAKHGVSDPKMDKDFFKAGGR